MSLDTSFESVYITYAQANYMYFAYSIKKNVLKGNKGLQKIFVK